MKAAIEENENTTTTTSSSTTTTTVIETVNNNLENSFGFLPSIGIDTNNLISIFKGLVTSLLYVALLITTIFQMVF